MGARCFRVCGDMKGTVQVLSLRAESCSQALSYSPAPPSPLSSLLPLPLIKILPSCISSPPVPLPLKPQVPTFGWEPLPRPAPKATLTLWAAVALLVLGLPLSPPGHGLAWAPGRRGSSLPSAPSGGVP